MLSPIVMFALLWSPVLVFGSLCIWRPHTIMKMFPTMFDVKNEADVRFTRMYGVGMIVFQFVLALWIAFWR